MEDGTVGGGGGGGERERERDFAVLRPVNNQFGYIKKRERVGWCGVGWGVGGPHCCST